MAQAPVAAVPAMKSKGQTRKEAFDPTESLSSPRHLLRIGALNTRTMYQTGRTAQILGEMQRFKLSILGVSETRWTGAGKITFPTGQVLCYSGREDNQHLEGVGLIVDREARKSLMEWEPVNSRIIRARFMSRTAKFTIIQCYAPTEETEEESKEEFYSKLQEQLVKVSNHDILIVLGDFNAKIGCDNTGYERNMGKHGLRTRNDNEERFLEMCLENDLAIGGTLFQHKRIHKETWISPDGRTRNQIDHVAINQRWRTSLQDVKAVRGVDVDSDHHLVMCKLKLKLRKNKRTANRGLLNSQKLKDPAMQQAFSIELSNRFHLLDEMPADDIDAYCNKVKETFLETSKHTIGYQVKHRKSWISDNTWGLIEERRVLKQSVLGCREDQRAARQDLYKEKSRQVKNSARKDKRQFLDNKAYEAEEAARQGDTRTLYRITRELAGARSVSCSVVTDKEGKPIANEEEQRARWAEHFKTVLNHPEPETQAEVQETANEFEMKQQPITCTEIEEAIKETKGNRAPGEDLVTADMLKADSAMSAKCLVELFNKVWTEEEVPDAWKRGIIIKLPKKGDLKECGNWRGINLLSVPGKIFCRVMLHRIKTSLDKILREEQAGFRPGRSCTDQIFVLRTIIEQSIEWNSSLYLNFIDFEKAFDSVHHCTLWRILKLYGFPDKIINILKSMYANNQCCVRHGGQESEWFRVKSGVRQGCVISPMLFLVVIDWIMKRATVGRPRGIVWNAFDNLEDEDFADDIALVSHSHRDMEEKTRLIEDTAKSVGLKISHAKTKVMRLNAKNKADISSSGQSLENVTEFKYLGSFLTADGNIEKEIRTRIALASAAFQRLRPIWRSGIYDVKTKLRLYKSNVRSVLLYAAETWHTTKQIESKLRGFEGRCLRRILGIWWEHRVTNKEIESRTGISCIVEEVKKRRWRWLGHTLRMNKKRHPLIALNWNPQGKRNRGRPRGTWRRTVDAERTEAGMTWHELRWLAQDRKEWRKFVDALCSREGIG